MTIDPAAAAPPHDLLVLVSRALGLARHGALDRAARMVERIGREYPEEGVYVACLAWCDALIRAHPEIGAAAARGALSPGFLRADTGETGGVDDVPPRVVWAGRFMVARATMDHDTTEALVQSCSGDEEFSSAVMSVLDMVASGIDHPGLLVAPGPR